MRRVANDLTSVRLALYEATSRLSTIEEDRLARIEAEVLLCHQMQITRAQLYTRLDDILSDDQADGYAALIERRLRHEPLAYITHNKEFYGLNFYVDPRVLIPRPETEHLVEKALEWLRQQKEPEQGWLIVDVGTGSAAIAATLAVHLPRATVVGIDASSEALEVARINCIRHGVARRVTLRQGDLLDTAAERFDVIVANLPYVTEDDMIALSPDIRGYEPLEALDGGKDGLDLYRRLLHEAPRHLRENGSLLAEIGLGQGEAMLELARKSFPDAAIGLIEDYNGIDRIVTIENRPLIAPHECR